MSLLPQEFYSRDALEVAKDLLGKELRRGRVVLKISEVEAYRWPSDSANHCHKGRTQRNEPMWGPAGHCYVYLCYGIHNMLNVVTNLEGEGAAVLIRSCEVIQGASIVRKRRAYKEGPVLLTGPGKIGQALALDTTWSNHCLYEERGLELHDGPPVGQFLKGPRVGIDYAKPKDVKAPWRFALANTAWVSQRKSLKVARA